MKKETIIAVFLGVLLGLSFAVILIFNLRQSEPKKAGQIGQSNITPSPKTKTLEVRPLEVLSPTDTSIINKNSVIIKGKASKDSLIVIQSPIKDEVFKNEKEDFSVTFPLALGENVITIASYPKKAQANPQIKTLRVYFLDEQ